MRYLGRKLIQIFYWFLEPSGLCKVKSRLWNLYKSIYNLSKTSQNFDSLWKSTLFKNNEDAEFFSTRSNIESSFYFNRNPSRWLEMSRDCSKRAILKFRITGFWFICLSHHGKLNSRSRVSLKFSQVPIEDEEVVLKKRDIPVLVKKKNKESFWVWEISTIRFLNFKFLELPTNVHMTFNLWHLLRYDFPLRDR